MDNEEIVREELNEAESLSEDNSEAEISGQEELSEQTVQLMGEVAELKIRLALLVGGASPEKLDEGVRLALGLASADGIQPEEAAAEVLSEYPHIKLAKRSVPKLSAESGGKGDGFAAIRSIFARK